MISTISSLFKLAGVVLVSDRYEFKGDVDQPDNTGTGNEGSTKHAEQLLPNDGCDSELNSAGTVAAVTMTTMTSQSKRRRNRQKQRLRKGSIDHKVRFEHVEVVRVINLNMLNRSKAYLIDIHAIIM